MRPDCDELTQSRPIGRGEGRAGWRGQAITVIASNTKGNNAQAHHRRRLSPALAIPTAGIASVAVDANGVGYVGKGDVQSALGWNNGDFDKNVASLKFTAGAKVIAATRRAGSAAAASRAARPASSSPERTSRPRRCSAATASRSPAGT